MICFAVYILQVKFTPKKVIIPLNSQLSILYFFKREKT